MDNIAGIHHVITLGSDPRQSQAFYAGVLGLSEVAPYDLSGGSVVSFAGQSFEGRGGGGLSVLTETTPTDRRSTLSSTGAIVFATPPRSLAAWSRRFVDCGVRVTGRAWAFGEEHLCFNDPDGLDLALVEDPSVEGPSGAASWSPSGSVSPLRLHSVELHSRGPEDDVHRLLSHLGLPLAAREGPLFRFAIGAAPSIASIDLFSNPRSGSWHGGRPRVKTLALKVATAEALDALAISLAKAQFEITRTKGDRTPVLIAFADAFGFNIALCLADETPTPLRI